MMNDGQCVHVEATSPVEVLKSEHRVIEKVLDAVERAIRRDVLDRVFWDQALDFFRNFADGCHHAKEEDELFPALERAGVPREGGPIGCMLDEHETGRFLLRTVTAHVEAAERGDEAARKTVRDAALEYIALLRQHIQKEDNVLFTVADRVLKGDERQRMLRAFQHAEQADGNAGRHDRYVALAEDLYRRQMEPS